MSYGYAGRLLRVNLTTGEIRKEPLDSKLIEDFVGDFGINARLAYDLIKPHIDALSPENYIIIGAGPLVGTVAPATPRFSVFTKFPLTGVVAGGGGSVSFGPRLKQAGYDHVIITGRAARPVYLKILEDDVELCDARSLWGKDIFETTEELWARHGRKQSVIAIGQAGENLVKFAHCLVDRIGSLGKGGLGAVFGSKNLKAIIAGGNRGVKVADPQKFLKVARQVTERYMNWPDRERYVKLGHTMADWKGFTKVSGFGVCQNWHRKVDAETANKVINEEVYLTKLKKTRLACPSCPVADKDVLEVREGEYKGLKTFVSGVGGRNVSLGVRCGVSGYDRVAKLTDMVQRYGICTHVFGDVVMLAQELYERGIITSKDTEGLPITTGFDTIKELIERVTFRRGIGDTLADGYPGIFKRFGKEAEKYAVKLKGMSPMVDPRGSRMRPGEFGQVVNPRAGWAMGGHSAPGMFKEGVTLDNMKVWCAKVGVDDEAMSRIFPGSGEINVARLTRHDEDFLAAFLCLGQCGRQHIAQFYDMTTHAGLYTAATGIPMTPEKLKQAGERAWTLLKVLNVREGFDRKDDAFPRQWTTEPMKFKEEGVEKELRLKDYSQTRVLTADDLEKLLDDYYNERDWDIKRGIPTKEKLVSLGLADIAEDLEKSGLIG